MERNRDKRERENQPKEFLEKLIKLNAVSKTVKGGRRRSFSALVVVGDQKGRVGYGMGKANDVSDAIRKATENAKKSLMTINLKDSTIPHEVLGQFKSASVLLKPASPGTGIIAGGPARAVIEMAGIKNIRTKSLGSNNKQNVVLATIAGLQSMKTPEEIARLRGKSVSEILG